jgi:hypothetical protein
MRDNNRKEDMSSIEPNSGSSKGMLWTGRVLSGLIVLFMLLDGVMKLIKPQLVIDATKELRYPESTIIGIGIAATLSALLYAIPQTAVLGAILLTGYLGGAVATHVRVGESVFIYVFAAVFGVIAWLGLYLRDARLRSLVPLRAN